MFPSGRIGTASARREPEPLAVERRRRRRDGEPDAQPCGKNGSSAAVQPATSAASPAATIRPGRNRTDAPAARCRRRASASSAAEPPRRAAPPPARRPKGAAPDRARARGRPAAASAWAGRDGAPTSGAAPASIARAVSSMDVCQNGWRPASASQSITPTAQTSAASVASSPASRSGAMYASVPGTSPCAVSVSASAMRASPKSSSRTDTSSPSASSTFDGFTSRWRIPARARARAPRRSARSPRSRRGRPARPPASPRGTCALGRTRRRCRRVADRARTRRRGGSAGWRSARRRVRLPLGARRRLALAGDDLQRDVEPVLLVPGQPDGAGAAAPERTQRPVAPEDESTSFQRKRGVRHTPPTGWRPGRTLLLSHRSGRERSKVCRRTRSRMSTYDDDNIEFDFFDEPETKEASTRRRLPGRPGGGRGDAPAEAAEAAGPPATGGRPARPARRARRDRDRRSWSCSSPGSARARARASRPSTRPT